MFAFGIASGMLLSFPVLYLTSDSRKLRTRYNSLLDQYRHQAALLQQCITMLRRTRPPTDKLSGVPTDGA